MQTVDQHNSGVPDENRNSAENNYVPPKRKPIYSFFKRMFDIILSIIALILLSPVFLVISILIKAEDGGKIIYKSTRLTKDGKEFGMYKFRSMIPNAEKLKDSLMDQNEVKGPAFKMKDDPRITKIGKFIRKTSIDELPQLVNILIGDMTIIGPRPPLPQEVAQYTPYQLHRLDVKTGLACYHEVEGRSETTDFDEWVEQDLRYIRERSLWTDIKIIFKLFKVVITGKGAA